MGEEAKMKFASCCPAFNIENIGKKISLLPESITIDKNWEVEYESELTESGVKKVPVGIAFIEPEEEGKPAGGFMVDITEGIKERGVLDGQGPVDLSKIDLSKLSNEEVNKLIDKYREGKITGKPPRWEDVPF